MWRLKQHATKQPMGQRRNQKDKSKNTFRQMKMEIQHTKICVMQQKQF